MATFKTALCSALERAIDNRIGLQATYVIFLLWVFIAAKSVVVISIASLLLSTTTFWYLEFIPCRLMPDWWSRTCSVRLLVAILLVNFIVPAMFLVPTLSESRPRSQPSAISSISSVSDLTVAQDREKDSNLAKDIRDMEFLWCSVLSAACVASPELAHNESFIAEWATNTTIAWNFSKFMSKSKYAKLEKRAKDGGFRCEPKDYCTHGPPSENTVRDVDATTRQAIANQFLALAAILYRRRVDKFGLVQSLHEALDHSDRIRGNWTSRSKKILDVDGQQQQLARFQWWWPFTTAIGLGRSKARQAWWSTGNDDDYEVVLNSTRRSLEQFTERIQILRADLERLEKESSTNVGSRVKAIERDIDSLLSGGVVSTFARDWMRSLTTEVVKNMTAWDVWNTARDQSRDLEEALTILNVGEGMGLEKKAVIENAEWWKGALEDGKLGAEFKIASSELLRN